MTIKGRSRAAAAPGRRGSGRVLSIAKVLVLCTLALGAVYAQGGLNQCCATSGQHAWLAGEPVAR